MAYINKINVDGVAYEVKDENALPAADLPEAINTALAQAKESGEFDGPAGEQGPQGPAGESGVYVGTDTPPEGTKVWINPNGVATFPMPTADDAGKVLKAKGANEAEWGDAPSGGGSSEKEWVLIKSINTTEELNNITVEIDTTAGYKQFYAQMKIVGSANNGANQAFRMGFNNSSEGTNKYLCYMGGLVLNGTGTRFAVAFRDLLAVPVPATIGMSGTGSPATLVTGGLSDFDTTPKDINRFYCQVDGGKLMGVGTMLRVYAR